MMQVVRVFVFDNSEVIVDESLVDRVFGDFFGFHDAFDLKIAGVFKVVEIFDEDGVGNVWVGE